LDIVRNAHQHIQSSAVVVNDGEHVEAEDCDEWKKASERIEMIHSNAKQISAVAEEIRLLREDLCIAPFSTIGWRNRSRTPIRSPPSLSPTISPINSPTITPTMSPRRSLRNSRRTSSENALQSITPNVPEKTPPIISGNSPKNTSTINPTTVVKSPTILLEIAPLSLLQSVPQWVLEGVYVKATERVAKMLRKAAVQMLQKRLPQLSQSMWRSFITAWSDMGKMMRGILYFINLLTVWFIWT